MMQIIPVRISWIDELSLFVFKLIKPFCFYYQHISVVSLWSFLQFFDLSDLQRISNWIYLIYSVCWGEVDYVVSLSMSSTPINTAHPVSIEYYPVQGLNSHVTNLPKQSFNSIVSWYNSALRTWSLKLNVALSCLLLTELLLLLSHLTALAAASVSYCSCYYRNITFPFFIY